ncbi:MAG: type II toxin-antitoxin system RelE/ParE family toxin [Saprospiraceae bacterium]|nr:type II toxin-antitoxin system RelE/ParE family toxin [Saprospiraceae bacterium]
MQNIFCYDEDKIVVIMNGFTKQTQKTPRKK